MTSTNDTTTNDAIGSASVIPILVYEDIEAGHDYLVETFGFTSGGLHRIDDGTVVHGEVRLGDALVWLHRVTEESELTSPKGSAMAHGGLEVIARRPTSPTGCASTALGTRRTTVGGSAHPSPDRLRVPRAPSRARAGALHSWQHEVAGELHRDIEPIPDVDEAD
jgi:hypothetical protein